MKRIAFISHLDEISGGTIALVDTAAALQQAGYDCTLVLPGNGPIASRAAEKHLRTVTLANPAVALSEAGLWRAPAIAARRAAYTARLGRFFLRQRFDLIYINTSASVFPGLAARMAGVSVLWHIHETLNGNCPLLRMKKALIGRLAKGLAYASQSGIDAFPPGDVPHLVVRNQVAMEPLRAVRKRRMKAQEHLRAHENDRPAPGATPPARLLANGIFLRKGADVLLDAALIMQERGEIPAPYITLAGDTTAHPEYFELLRSHQYTVAFPERVQFAGVVPGMDFLFESADVFVSASRNEALPIAIVEAMAAGVPVVSTAVGDCADLLNGGLCGWVVAPESPRALAVALTEAITQPQEAVRRVEAAAEKVEVVYGAEDFWQPLVDFIESLNA